MKKALAILLTLTMLLSLTAYGSSTAPASGSTKSDQKSAGAVGSYKLTSQTGNLDKNMSDIINVVQMGATLYLSLKEDGTGSMQLLDAKIPLKWDNSDIIIQPIEGHDLTSPVRLSYTCEEDSLIINTKNYSLYFSRLTKQELAEYKEKGGGSLKGKLNKISQMLFSNIEDGLGDLLFLALVLGAADNEIPPIPEGEPSAGPVTGTVNGIAFTILGADQVQSEEGTLIVFYFEAANTTDDYQEFWAYSFEASQKGSFLEDTWGLGDIPEEYNVNYGMAPGRTLRCAAVFKYDPDGGVVGFRISSFEDKENTVLYYADPRNLSGAPEEPFAFDADPSVPEYVQALPAEIEEVRIENAEFFTDEDGDQAIRIFFTFCNTSEKDAVSFYQNYNYYALQDGIELYTRLVMSEPTKEETNDGQEIKPGEEILCANSYKLRTGSPVSFVVYRDISVDEKIYVAAKTYEIK